MLLAVDIGNTETTLGLFADDKLRSRWRMTTATDRTPDEWSAMITGYVINEGHSTHEVRAAVEASVAPVVTAMLSEGVNRAIGVNPVTVSAATDLPVVLDVEDPLSVGADRVVNSLAALHLYQRDTIVVDFGTATTFDCVMGDGRFIGGVIAPGVRTASEELVKKAAKLFATELVEPENVIGRRTEDCIRSGILYSSSDSVDGIVRRIKASWPGENEPYVVATGGMAPVIVPLTTQVEHVEPDLALHGLLVAAKHLGLEW